MSRFFNELFNGSLIVLEWTDGKQYLKLRKYRGYVNSRFFNDGRKRIIIPDLGSDFEDYLEKAEHGLIKNVKSIRLATIKDYYEYAVTFNNGNMKIDWETINEIYPFEY